MPTSTLEIKQEWQAAWSIPSFRIKLITAVILTVAVLSCFPVFFQWAERRHGTLLNDPVLQWLPAHNVSIAIFILIWTLAGLGILRAIQNPRILLTFLWAYVLLSLSRFLSITLLPLEPPVGLIGLVDPLSNFFYGPKFVTKDLFFSGHTSTMVLIICVLTYKNDRRLAVIVACGVAVLLLVQHVHYTLDVLAAFPLAWLCWWVAVHTVVRDHRY
jgi:hypothetical protein